MSLIKRFILFISSCALIIIIMAAVLEDEPQSAFVFSSSQHTLSVIDSESLLPLSQCNIVIIGDDSSYKTDSNGKLLLSNSDASIIITKEGYTTHLLLHHDFSSDNANIKLLKRDDTPFTVSVYEKYAGEIIECWQ